VNSEAERRSVGDLLWVPYELDEVRVEGEPSDAARKDGLVISAQVPRIWIQVR